MLAQVLIALALVGPSTSPPVTTRGLDIPAVPSAAEVVKGLELWRGSKVGMSVSEVNKLFPNAAPPFQQNVLTGGQVNLLRLEAVQLDGRPAVADFYFSGSELVAVELTSSGFRSGRPVHNMALAKSISAGYEATYGEGYDCGDKSLGDIAAYECKWLKGRLSIQLWYMDVAGQAPLFFIAYRQADDPIFNL